MILIFLNVCNDVHNLKQMKTTTRNRARKDVMSEDEDLGNNVSGGSSVRSGDYET